MMRAAAEPMKNCRYCQFSLYAVAGTPMMVRALTSVATKDKHATIGGTFLEPRKKSLVLRSLRPNAQEMMKSMATARATIAMSTLFMAASIQKAGARAVMVFFLSIFVMSRCSV